jgi:hypothetical protein
MSAHPAQVRDAIQQYIEQAYRPVLTFHVQIAVTDRLDTYMGQVGSQMFTLERDGKIAKYVSPSGREYWYSPKSETFCGTCGALALPGIHPNPDCNRHVPAPGDKPTGRTEDKPTTKTEVSPDQVTALIRHAVQAAEGEDQLNPRPDGETPADRTRRLVTAAVLHLVEQQLLVIPPDPDQRLARSTEMPRPDR